MTMKNINPIERRYRKETIIKPTRVSATFLYIKEQENQKSDFLSSSFLIKV